MSRRGRCCPAHSGALLPQDLPAGAVCCGQGPLHAHILLGEGMEGEVTVEKSGL